MSKSFTYRKPYKLRGTRLLAAIVAFILAEPKRFNMELFTQEVSPNAPDAPACGTVACLAGWADVLTSGYVDTYSNGMNGGVEQRAIEVLQLTKEEANSLFYVHKWPEPFREQFGDVLYVNTPRARVKRAEIAAARVQDFITNKRRKMKRLRDRRYRANRKARLAQAA